jgi:hypothetical protein
MIKYIIVLFFCVFVISCSKENDPQTDKKTNEESENTEDLNLSLEEKFSTAVMVDFLNESEDDDLASFLETEIYKMGSSYTGGAVVEVTPSTWLVSFEKDSTTKNFLLQKFIDFKTTEYYFSMKPTTLTITDIITRSRNKIPAGEDTTN